MAWKKLTFILIPHSQSHVKQVSVPRKALIGLIAFLVVAIARLTDQEKLGWASANQSAFFNAMFDHEEGGWEALIFVERHRSEFVAYMSTKLGGAPRRVALEVVDVEAQLIDDRVRIEKRGNELLIQVESGGSTVHVALPMATIGPLLTKLERAGARRA